MDSKHIKKWAKKELWSEREAAWICSGLDPEGANENTDTVNEVTQELRRAVLRETLNCITQSDASRGARFYGESRFFYPKEIARWAKKKGFPILGEMSKHLPVKEELGPRERDSILKIIVGMAISKYEYDPKKSKNTAARRIAEDLQRQALDLDEDTIRSYLQEAANLLPGG
jgi:hypothetical protein